MIARFAKPHGQTRPRARLTGQRPVAHLVCEGPTTYSYRTDQGRVLVTCNSQSEAQSVLRANGFTDCRVLNRRGHKTIRDQAPTKTATDLYNERTILAAREAV